LSPDPINLCGQTDLKQLAAVMAECRTFVSNDSGAMQLAAAVGVPVVAIFGSTNQKETAPGWPGTGDQGSGIGGRHAIVTTDAPCRPCMLRECPIENHPCMTGIDVGRVREEVLARLNREHG
jgi:heptosyltransferase-2